MGGEEFAIVLPETGHEAALEVARRLCDVVGASAFKIGGKALKVTASFGVCGIERVAAGERAVAERVVKIADAALYRSKREGRNRATGARFF